MIKSMTAFARYSAPVREGHWVIEIRSVNHRFFEFSMKISPGLADFENPVRELVQNKMKRGKITVAVSRETSKSKSRQVSLDEKAVEFYLASLRKLKKKYKLQGEISVSDLLRLPGLFSAEDSSQDPEKSWPHLKKALSTALDKAVKAREIEGCKLAEDISSRLEAVAKAVRKIENHIQGQSERLFQRLKQRIDVLLSDREKDEERLSREVAFMAERSDITEELVRLRSHLDLFTDKLKTSGELGRELDFLCQEMNREVNTIASKSQHFEISTEVVFMKGELEKIREQIQNIE